MAVKPLSKFTVPEMANYIESRVKLAISKERGVNVVEVSAETKAMTFVIAPIIVNLFERLLKAEAALAGDQE
jgi:hypothetical protein